MFGNVVRAHRRRLGATQEELAHRAGLSARCIRDIETGRITQPRAGTVRRLADAFALAGADRERFCEAALTAEGDSTSPSAEPMQSDLLVYFCEPAPAASRFSADLAGVGPPRARLDQILGGKRLTGVPPPGADPDQPAVSFTEASAGRLVRLIESGRQPWGLLFRRQWVFEQGGEPVSYMGRARWERRRREDKPWAALIGASATAGGPDRTQDREWRIPLDPDRPYLVLTPGSVVGILVGDRTWRPGPVQSGQPAGDSPFDQLWLMRPSRWAAVPRWFWDPSTRQLLAPAPTAVASRELVG